MVVLANSMKKLLMLLIDYNKKLKIQNYEKRFIFKYCCFGCFK